MKTPYSLAFRDLQRPDSTGSVSLPRLSSSFPMRATETDDGNGSCGWIHQIADFADVFGLQINGTVSVLPGHACTELRVPFRVALERMTHGRSCRLLDQRHWKEGEWPT